MKRIVLILLIGLRGASGCYRTSIVDDPAAEDESDRSTADGDADGDTDGDADGDTDADADTDCTDVTPCGGDLVGTWRVTSSCLAVAGALSMEQLGLMHCSAPITGTLDVTGTWTADVDGTYSDNTTTTGNVQLDWPCACQEFDGSCIACNSVGRFFASVGYTSMTCEDNPNPAVKCYCGSGCICTAAVDEASGLGLVTGDAATGNYKTEGGILTVDEAWSEQAYAYCVSETALTMTPLSTDWTGTLTGTVELLRQ